VTARGDVSLTEVQQPVSQPASEPQVDGAANVAATDPSHRAARGSGFGTWWSERRPAVGEAFAATWLPWLVSRLVVLGALALAKYEVHDLHLSNSRAVLQTRLALLGSDAGWYQSIAAHGYHAISRSALRFFPLFPLSARALHDVLGISVGAALVVIANVCAFAASMVIYGLAKRELGSAGEARSAVWLFSLAPVAFVFVMGYAEALFVLLAAASLLCLRTRHWWWAAAFGLLAGATRPIGCLLAVPALIEALRAWRSVPLPQWVGRAAAVLAPVGGLLAYLLWVGSSFGDALLPFRVQVQAGHRGAFADPFATLYHDAQHLLHRQHLGTGVHLPWVLVAVALLVVTFRKLPASYGAFAAVLLLAAVSGSNLDSFERYALSAFPLVIAAGSLLRSRRVELTVLVVSTAALVGYSLLAFQGAYVP
jgi:hypothetical protein